MTDSRRAGKQTRPPRGQLLALDCPPESPQTPNLQMVLTPGPRGLVGAGTGSTAGAAPARRDDLHEQHPARFQPVTHSGAFRAVGGGPLCAALDALLGAGQWTRPRWWGRPLVTFPRDGGWELPAR